MRYAIEEVQDLGNKLLRRLERIQGYDKLYDAIDTIVSSPREIGGDSAELTVISNTNVPEDIEGDVEAFYKAAEEVATQNGYISELTSATKRDNIYELLQQLLDIDLTPDRIREAIEAFEARQVDYDDCDDQIAEIEHEFKRQQLPEVVCEKFEEVVDFDEAVYRTAFALKNLCEEGECGGGEFRWDGEEYSVAVDPKSGEISFMISEGFSTLGEWGMQVDAEDLQSFTVEDWIYTILEQFEL